MTLPSHLLMTADAVGGVWTYALDLARGLARQGVRTTLVVLGPAPSSSQRAEAENIPDLSLHLDESALEWMPNPWTDVDASGERLIALAEAVRPDVVHLNGMAHAALPFGVPVVSVVHSDCLSWWRAVKGENAPDEYAEYARRVGEGLRSADLVVAPTAAMLEEARGLYGPFRDSRVILNGREASGFVPGDKRPMVLTAGRAWDEAKNVAALDRVAPDVRWPIYLAGDTGDLPRLTHLNTLGKLNPGVMGAWFGRASVYALPARYEPFGLSVLEAALAGCALVLGDIPTLRELWSDAAVFVKPDDHHGLSTALNWLAEDEDARTRLGAAAHERASGYTLRAMVDGYLHAYDSLLAPVTPGEVALR